MVTVWFISLLHVQVRFVKADDIWLSPNFERDSCHITLTIVTPQKVVSEKYFSEVYHSLRRLGFEPRVHWGKEFNITPDELQSMYPKLKDFVAIRKELDPFGIFLNQLLARTFELE